MTKKKLIVHLLSYAVIYMAVAQVSPNFPKQKPQPVKTQSPAKTATVNKPDGYVDLELPSGARWKSMNEDGFYTYTQAVHFFGENLPTKSQWQELIGYCRWEWTGRGYKVVGKNGNFIYLPAEGLISVEDGHVLSECGFYWSSTIYPGREGSAYRLGFSWNEEDIDGGFMSSGRSVRLVK